MKYVARSAEAAEIKTDEHGGRIGVTNNQGEIRVVMGVNEYGNRSGRHLG